MTLEGIFRENFIGEYAISSHRAFRICHWVHATRKAAAEEEEEVDEE